LNGAYLVIVSRQIYDTGIAHDLKHIKVLLCKQVHDFAKVGEKRMNNRVDCKTCIFYSSFNIVCL